MTQVQLQLRITAIDYEGPGNSVYPVPFASTLARRHSLAPSLLRVLIQMPIRAGIPVLVGMLDRMTPTEGMK